jgi:4-hydroxy-4-methyl-2-oxoglutarate aldolase
MVHVVKSFQRVPDDLVKQFKKLTAATVYEASGAKGALSSRIKPISPDMVVCGTAVTVKMRPKDNLMLHKAIYVAKPGDVIVADAEGYTEGGAWGEVMSFAAKQRGIAGLVFNGAVRDSQAITALGFPIFAVTLCIKETEKISLGLINHPLNFDNQTINPGDLILGDRDGVVVVKRENAAEILRNSQARDEKEKVLKERILRGETTLTMFPFGEILKSRGLTEEE